MSTRSKRNANSLKEGSRIRFSEQYGIEITEDDDWYDPLLSIDTALGLDPFLIVNQEHPYFSRSAQLIVDFFNSNFELLAQSGGNERSNSYLKAINNLCLGEFEEACLGFTESGTAGSGTGLDLTKEIARGMLSVLTAGVADPLHFEELSIFGPGLGPDRISDAVGHILFSHLSSYTLEICMRHDIATTEHHYQRGQFDTSRSIWTPAAVQLPLNPYNGKGIILCPKLFLREFPTINPVGFWSDSYRQHNEELRRYFGNEIRSHVRKETIVEFAHRRPDLVKEYVERTNAETPIPYDLDADPSLVWQWDQLARDYVRSRGLLFAITSPASFYSAIDEMVNDFKHYVEQNGGWDLLWNDNGSPRFERAAQRLFLGVVRHHCMTNDIRVSPEADIGRGPVDFEFSRGFKLSALLEVKKVSNTRYWHGLTTQLPTYLHAARTKVGYFLAVAYNSADIEKANSEVSSIMRSVKERSGVDIRYIVVDARRPPSASRS